MKIRIRGEKGGGWETTCCRTPTQSWVMNEKAPPTDVLKILWSQYPKAAEKWHLPRSHRAKGTGTWSTVCTAGWQIDRIQAKDLKCNLQLLKWSSEVCILLAETVSQMTSALSHMYLCSAFQHALSTTALLCHALCTLPLSASVA